MQVDDVDSVTFAKDVFLHLWIPALGLVREVNAGFEQFFHANGRQTSSSVVSQVTVANPHHGPKRDLWASQPICWPRMNSDEAKEIRVYVRPKKQPYRFENWKRLRAPFCPYFLRSLIRGSRVISPACFSVGRKSALYSSNARVMP